eukprot:UN01653
MLKHCHQFFSENFQQIESARRIYSTNLECTKITQYVIFVWNFVLLIASAILKIFEIQGRIFEIQGRNV